MRRDRRPREPAWGSLHPLLDLHGLTAEEAARHAEHWLRGQQAKGERVVVLVTGRGNRSATGPVLRGEMEHLLARLTGSLVAGWEPESAGGALKVRLAAAPPAPATLADRRIAARLADADPALRAEAEAALWELGVTPTPALVDAEIRRLNRMRGLAGED
jgi:hypothetical protein